MMEIPDYIKNRYWKDFLPAGIPLEIDLPEKDSMFDSYRNNVKNYGDTVAFDFYGKEFTYSVMENLTKRFAKALIGLGVKKGDVVALWIPNCPQFITSYFAILGVGATITAVSPLFVGREFVYQIQDSGAKFLIIIDRFFKVYERTKKKLSIEKAIIINIEGNKPDIPETEDVIHFDTLIAQNPEPLPDEEFDKISATINPKEDVAVIQYTGGTTGLPKGACLSHYNILSNVRQLLPAVDYIVNEYLKENICTLSVLPWYHIYGQTCELALSPFLAAKAFILPTFDVPRIAEILSKHKPNAMLGVTTMFITFLNAPQMKDVDLSSLKFVNVGAGALPAELAKEWESKTGFAMGEGYGLSETSPGALSSPPWAKKKPGSCGHPLPNTLIGIINESLEFLPIGEAGEVVIAGPQVMLRYHNRPEETEKVFFEAGGYRWLRTGDLGKLDEEGYMFLLDRIKDLIKYKGHSVYPREVEEILYEHPAIKECTIIGVQDPMKGEDIKAVIILRDEYKGKITENELIEWSKENMAAYKYPRIVQFARSLPKSAVGKILRRKLREKDAKKQKKR
jgi:long-chain acyl-CoA synthetase